MRRVVSRIYIGFPNYTILAFLSYIMLERCKNNKYPIMIKKLQHIGNSQGIILEKALLKLLDVENDDRVEIIPQDEGLLIRKVNPKKAYRAISKKHRKSLDKLAE